MKTTIGLFNEEKQAMKTFFQLREELNPVNESAKALKGVSHDDIKSAKDAIGDNSLGHGTHELEHPDDTRGGANLSHPYAYAHHDKKTGKVTGVQVKDAKTTAQHIAKAMGHSSVTKSHHAIADYHNDSVNEATIVEAAIHSHADGTTVHHSDEDRGEIYTIKHGGKTHRVNTHAYTVPGETVAGNVKKHIEAQAPGIPSHAKKAISKHMADM